MKVSAGLEGFKCTVSIFNYNYFFILSFVDFFIITEHFLSLGKMLMEHETMKLKEQEEMASKELKEWKAQLKPRKQVYIYVYFKTRSLYLSSFLAS